MTMSARTLITIVTESSLEKTLAKELEELGARGYTVADVRGKGARGARDAEWDYDSNIRMDVICDATVADKITSHLKAKYYENFAMIIYRHEVAVLRPHKFEGGAD